MADLSTGKFIQWRSAYPEPTKTAGLKKKKRMLLWISYGGATTIRGKVRMLPVKKQTQFKLFPVVFGHYEALHFAIIYACLLTYFPRQRRSENNRRLIAGPRDFAFHAPLAYMYYAPRA